MFRMIKRIVVGLMDWFLYTVLSTKQKECIANLFTEKQKQQLKRIIKPGKKQTQMKKVERAKYRLYNLGFKKRGLIELQALYDQEEDYYLKRRAAWELAVYYANQYSKEGARKCLFYIPVLIKDVKDADDLRRAAILQAESLAMLGEIVEAKQVLLHQLTAAANKDVFLALANLSSSNQERDQWINKVYDLYEITTIHVKDEEAPSAYDQLDATMEGLRYDNLEDSPKVTVIVPAYNSEAIIETALSAMCKQTWMNLEILVVDDCSTDNTAEVVKQMMKDDKRIQLLRTDKNSGAYTARNVALHVATGDFITINDADDWSHPEKIKTQVEHLIKYPKVIGNFSNQARATNDLVFYRRGKPGIYSFPNMSSLMFRRQPVMDKLGYWDRVRFAGDSEFLKRVKLVFGEKSVITLDTAPLSFQRQSADSLTGDSAFGFPGYFMGVRKEYAEAHEHFHQLQPNNLYYPFLQQKRPFPVPAPMLPDRPKKDVRRHFDVIIASEFRLLGGTNMSNVEEVKAQQKLGLRTALMQMNRYDLNSVSKMNPKVRSLVNGEDVQVVVYGEKVSCDVLIVRHPPVLEEWQKYIPDVEAKHIRVIVNQPPKREYSETGIRLYHINNCVIHMKEYFGQTGKWYPIGPRIRETLHTHHTEELQQIDLADEDWVNIIDVQEWRRTTRPENEKIRIGRHSRDQYVKWPIEKDELLQIYPDKAEYAIYVLGGAVIPEKVLGQLPSNWHVYQFGEVHPKDFLADIDVFVYFTHPNWVEAFGRVIFEAMAVGVPVIIPPSYQALFGDAAIYAEPADVQTRINELMSNKTAYQAQVEKAQNDVETHFGYAKHAARLEECSHDRQNEQA